MCGRVHDGRRLLFDLAADEAGAPVPTRLTQATVESVASSAGPGAGLFDGSSDQSTCEHRARWQVQGDQGQFAFDAARLFIHEDFSRQAATIIPPRDVPFGKRLAWQLAFALLATSFGRRWLARRAR